MRFSRKGSKMEAGSFCRCQKTVPATEMKRENRMAVNGRPTHSKWGKKPSYKIRFNARPAANHRKRAGIRFRNSICWPPCLAVVRCVIAPNCTVFYSKFRAAWWNRWEEGGDCGNGRYLYNLPPHVKVGWSKNEYTFSIFWGNEV
jgi:hypothetical protein